MCPFFIQLLPFREVLLQVGQQRTKAAAHYIYGEVSRRSSMKEASLEKGW